VGLSVPDSVGETGSSASSFFESSSSSGELSSDGGINLSISDGGSSELEAVCISDGMDILFTTPGSSGIRSADMEASPFSAFLSSLASTLLGSDSVGSGSSGELFDLGSGS